MSRASEEIELSQEELELQQRTLLGFYEPDGKRFAHFARHSGMVPDYESQPHDEMCAELEQCAPEIGTGKTQKKQFYGAPRFSYKTHLLICFMAWLILWFRTFGTNIRITYVRADTETAGEVLGELQGQLENAPRLVELFGSLAEEAVSWTEKQIKLTTSKDPTVAIGGLRRAKAGSHPDLVILDDMVNEDNYLSAVTKRTVLRKIKSFFMALPPWGSMIVCGTYWDVDDAYMTIKREHERTIATQKKFMEQGRFREAENHKPQWRFYERSAYLPNGDLFFPARLSHEFLDSQRKSIDPKIFASNYLMSPVVEGLTLFRDEYLQYVSATFYRNPVPTLEIVHDNGRVEHIAVVVKMTLDPTLSDAIGADDTGLTVVAFDAQGDWFCLRAKHLHEVPSRVGDIVGMWLIAFEPTELLIDARGGDPQMTARIQQVIMENNLQTQIRTYDPQRDGGGNKTANRKEKRIEAVEPIFRDMRIHLARGACDELVDQYRRFPGRPIDVFDAFSMHQFHETRCEYGVPVEASEPDLEDDTPDVEPEDDMFVRIRSPRDGQVYAVPLRSMEEPTSGGPKVGRAGMGSPRLRASALTR